MVDVERKSERTCRYPSPTPTVASDPPDIVTFFLFANCNRSKIELRSTVDDEVCKLKELINGLPQKLQREHGPPLFHILAE